MEGKRKKGRDGRHFLDFELAAGRKACIARRCCNLLARCQVVGSRDKNSGGHCSPTRIEAPKWGEIWGGVFPLRPGQGCFLPNRLGSQI